VPTYQSEEAPLWTGEMNYDEKFTGAFYLTNRRLLFEHKVGVIKKRDVLAAEIPLKDIRSASIEKGPWDWTVLVIATNDRRHRFLFRAESPEALAERIRELTASQKA